MMERELKASIVGNDIHEISERLDGLLLDLYPLSIANAPMSARDLRELVDDMGAHIGLIRQLLVKRTISMQSKERRR
jgi:hypothetical protein